MPDKEKLNNEGYLDPTAYAALKNISRDEKIESKATFLLSVLKYIMRESGFEPVGHIVLRHKKTGKVFR